MMPMTTKASALAPSCASSLPTCGPTASLRDSRTGSTEPAMQTCALVGLPASAAVSRVVTAPPSALQSSKKTRAVSSPCFKSARTGTRIMTSRELPKFCTRTSPRPRPCTVVLILAMSAGCA